MSENKAGATRIFLIQQHLAIEPFGDDAADGQSQAGSARFGARTCFSFDETAENVGTRLLRNLRSEIDDIGDPCFRVLR